MITISSMVLIFCLFLAYHLPSDDLLGKVLKALISMTVFSATLLLFSNLGYIHVDLVIQDCIRFVSTVAFISVGMFLNSYDRWYLILTKGACFALAAVSLFNIMVLHGYVIYS